jgi:histone acetyltransferase (RNA polymerase elongator complex component)
MKQLKRFIIPVFIPHEGCRFRCVFCDQHAVTGDHAPPVRPDSIRETVRAYRETIPPGQGEPQLAFFGGSFTALDEDRQEELLAVGRELIDAGLIQSIRVSTRPDAIDETVMDRLIRFGVRTVEIGVQTMEDNVLARSQRGHTVCETVQAVQALKSQNVEWIAQIMPGLPGDTQETMIRTAERVADLLPDGVRIYPALVISGTRMERMYESGQYTPLPLPQAIRIVKRMVEVFEARSIPIIRIGLCPSANLKGRVVAGPYHPALGSLVYEALLLDEMIAAVGQKTVQNKRIVIYVHPHDISRAVGNRRSSMTRLTQRFPGKDFSVVGDYYIKRGKVRANGI